MNTEALIQAVEVKVKGMIEAEPDLFLVETRIKPTNNIKVFVDGDNGVSIERLVQLNRKLYKEIETDNWFPNGDFSLELSSPGLDEPLKLYRQYQKNLNRPVEVIKKDGIKLEGKMIHVSEENIQLEEVKGKGKKMEIVQHTVPFDEIKTTRIQIKF